MRLVLPCRFRLVPGVMGVLVPVPMLMPVVVMVMVMTMLMTMVVMLGVVLVSLVCHLFS
ncbi:hypothetical protein [Cystobacter fuscus]|nr:hypothetical protein [Cystobacter fuscus]